MDSLSIMPMCCSQEMPSVLVVASLGAISLNGFDVW